jgi:hypothetical protein
MSPRLTKKEKLYTLETAERMKAKIAHYNSEIANLNYRMKQTDSDMFEYYAGLEIDALEAKKAKLYKHIQEIEMREWNL